MRQFLSVYVCSALALACATSIHAGEKNGFLIEDPLVPAKEILSGGPGRDGIPSLDYPTFIAAGQENYLQPDDRVLGVHIGGTAKAYPIKILNWHELVNDKIGNQFFVVSYCPLCGSGMVFVANVQNSALVFGVSGLLYDSDVLMYDRNTESLWSQIMAKAINGKLKGTELPQIPSHHTTWAHWQALYPDTQVLSDRTGFRRNYAKSPYRGYERSRKTYFRVSNKAPKSLHPKALVLGVTFDGQHRAYPFKTLEAQALDRFEDTVGDTTITVHWDRQHQSAWATQEGQLLATTVAYWFAWYTFHPKTSVFPP